MGTCLDVALVLLRQSPFEDIFLRSQTDTETVYNETDHGDLYFNDADKAGLLAEFGYWANICAIIAHLKREICDFYSITSHYRCLFENTK